MPFSGNSKTKKLVQGALIGALYAALTLIAQPISYGLMQVRISEALCILPFFSASAMPGLFVGCLIANLLGGAPLYDIIFGSLATLLAAYSTHLIRKKNISKWLAPLPAVLINAFVVGALLTYVYEVGVPFLTASAYVGAGQAIACYGFGMPLLLVLRRYAPKIFGSDGLNKDRLEEGNTDNTNQIG